MSIRLCVAILGGLLFSGVLLGQVKAPRTSSPSRPSAPVTDLQRQVDALRLEVVTLQKSLMTLQNDNLQLELRVFKLEDATYAVAALDPASLHTYERLDTAQGTFLVALEAVSPYLDGYKITLDIGNTSSAKYNGFTLHTSWNSRFDWSKFTQDTYASWQKAMRKKDDTFTNMLYPGTWNEVEVMLPTTTGDQLGYLEVSMETNTVVMVPGSVGN